MSRSKKENKESGQSHSLMETNPNEAWDLFARLEFEGPGGMTGLPILRPTRQSDKNYALRTRRVAGSIDDSTRDKVCEMVSSGLTRAEIAKRLNISLPSVTALRDRLIKIRTNRLASTR
jgi:DNA-binding CsgD family transcriptional regulator